MTRFTITKKNLVFWINGGQGTVDGGRHSRIVKSNLTELNRRISNIEYRMSNVECRMSNVECRRKHGNEELL